MAAICVQTLVAASALTLPPAVLAEAPAAAPTTAAKKTAAEQKKDAAKQKEEDNELSEVVVTGTLIRGIAPTGANTFTVTREDVSATGASTMNQVLATVPQIGNFFNQLPQVDITSPAGTASSIPISKPNLRALPTGNTSSGATTLILVDGQRQVNIGFLSPGNGQASPDSESLPPGALERMEISTDSSSSTYGADAIGGVINYVTRRRFDGLQVSLRGGAASAYQTFDSSIMAGKDWGRGSLYGAWDYATHDAVYGRDRSFYNGIYWAPRAFPGTGTPVYTLPAGTPRGTQCDTPNITVAGAPTSTPYLAGPTSVSVAALPVVCDTSNDNRLYPPERHNSVLLSLAEDFSDRLKLDVRLRYSDRNSTTVDGPFRGSATMGYGAGPGTAGYNPWYRPAPAPFATANQTVNFSYGPVFGPEGARVFTEFEQWGITPSITYDFTPNWQMRASFNYGASKSTSRGTCIDANVLTAATSATATNLTTATAFNAYDVTQNSPTLLAALRNCQQARDGRDKLTNPKIVVDGKLFKMPGGYFRVAGGAEYSGERYESRFNNAAISSAPGYIETLPFIHYSRHVTALFAEVNIPIFGPDNARTLARALSVSYSGRYDKYSDFGKTVNPKLGLSYKPVDWLTLRGNWSKSFNAPTPVDELGAQNTFIARFDGAVNFCCGVIIPTGAVAPTPGTAYTYVLVGSDKDMKPQTGTSYSVGADIELRFIEGLRASVSYYSIDYFGALGIPNYFAGQAVFTNLYRQFGRFCPQNVPGLPTTAIPACEFTQADVLAWLGLSTTGLTFPLSDVASRPTYSLVDFRTRNLGNTKLRGVDFSMNYVHPTGFGSIDASVGGNTQLTNEAQSVTGAPFFSTLTTGTPHYRLSASLGFDVGQLRAQARMNHTGGFRLNPAVGLYQDHVSSFSPVDLYFRYKMGKDRSGWLADLEWTLNITNALDTDPPILRSDNGNGFTNGASLGRFWQLGVSKKLY
jgi:iron complex outermembrane recepter protein